MICLVKLNHIQLGKENSRTCLKPPPSYHTTSNVCSWTVRSLREGPSPLERPFESLLSQLIPQGGITIEFSLPIAQCSKNWFYCGSFLLKNSDHHICQLRKRLVVTWNRQGPGHESSLAGMCWLFVLPKKFASFQKDLSNGNPTKVPAQPFFVDSDCNCP